MKHGDASWKTTLLHILQEVRTIYKTRNQLIVDARGSGLAQPEAIRALARIQGITRGRLDRIRLLGDGYELSHTYT